MTTALSSLRYEVQRNNGTATMLIEGELEEVSAVQLARACLEAREVARDLTLDLRGIAFADGTGTKMLATIHRAFERPGHAMRIVNLPKCVQREVEALELDDVLPIPN